MFRGPRDPPPRPAPTRRAGAPAAIVDSALLQNGLKARSPRGLGVDSLHHVDRSPVAERLGPVDRVAELPIEREIGGEGRIV